MNETLTDVVYYIDNCIELEDTQVLRFVMGWISKQMNKRLKFFQNFSFFFLNIFCPLNFAPFLNYFANSAFRASGQRESQIEQW